MKRTTTIPWTIALLILSLPSLLTAQDDWPRWRGPSGDGIAASQNPPTKWSESENVVWKSKIPGIGHSSPIVIDQKIFLTTADLESKELSVVCFNRTSGDMVWQKTVSQGGFNPRIHPKNTHSSSTVATDGKFVFALFNHHGKVEVAAFDFDGNEIWKKDVAKYAPKYPFGFGASPIVFNDKVIVTSESTTDSGVYALDTKTGNQVWKIGRDGISSYSTPVVTTIAGKAQLLLSGGKKVASYNPDDGSEIWSVPASWDVTCGTIVWDGDLVFASGGFPSQETIAIDARSGRKVWNNKIKSYEQSMLVHDGKLYTLAEKGKLVCWNAVDGQEMWQQRFQGANGESASPVFAGGNIYFTAENGLTLVLKATADQYEEVAKNKLGDVSFASLAICGDQIFARVGKSGEKNSQWLYCLGSK